MSTKTCPICGQEFGDDFKPWRLKSQKYCSLACLGLANGNAKRGKKPSNYNPNNHVHTTCRLCGTDLVSTKWQPKQFCSVQCRRTWQSQNILGAMHPRYKGGVSFTNRGDNWAQQRKAALLRDDKTCQICRRTPKKGERYVLDVHHIKPYEAFNGDWLTANQLTNLITLCRPCHFKVDFHELPCPQLLL